MLSLEVMDNNNLKQYSLIKTSKLNSHRENMVKKARMLKTTRMTKVISTWGRL